LHLIIALLARATGRVITFQEAPGSCLKVLAILPDVLSLTAGSDQLNTITL
jgi:hypothetical protein